MAEFNKLSRLMRGDLRSEDSEVINSTPTAVIGDIALVIAISTLLGALLRRVWHWSAHWPRHRC
jgi:hypothetical protein